MRTGSAGGYSAAFLMLQSLGLIAPKGSAASTIPGTPTTGAGRKVVILGGGIAGLVAAYELRKLGYRCAVLEARDRPGGRNWTVRAGTRIDLDGYAPQTCSFDEGNYQNVGPARLPSIHGTILGYCRELGVELEVEVNTSRSSFLQNDGVAGGKAFVQRQVINDTRGHVAELLAKCASQGALDQMLGKEDRDRILDFLRFYGPLDSAGAYTGSDRAGYSQPPGAGDDAGVFSQPVDMHTLLDARFWNGILFEETFDMQATMFQPKGGMDRIPYAFAASLGDIVQFKSVVTELRKTSTGVRVAYAQDGAAKSMEADHCFCALPLTMLRKIPNDLSPAYQQVIDTCGYAGAYKVAWEARRFWEQDYNLYGGLSFLAQGCTPVWYPSAKLFSPRGVIVAGYSNEVATPFEGLPMEKKFEESRGSIERLHPGHGRELEKPIYVGWSKVAFNQGSWLQRYSPGHDRTSGRPDPAYETLIQPDGPITLIGDHCSHIVAWQEGAALSAHRAIRMLNERMKSA
jgi:monoamine oxidase